jgi:hypothetical protein
MVCIPSSWYRVRMGVSDCCCREQGNYPTSSSEFLYNTLTITALNDLFRYFRVVLSVFLG